MRVLCRGQYETSVAELATIQQDPKHLNFCKFSYRTKRTGRRRRRLAWAVGLLSLSLACFVAAPVVFSADADSGAESPGSLKVDAPDAEGHAAPKTVEAPFLSEPTVPGVPGPTPKSSGGAGEFRDPTQPGPELRDLLAPAKSGPSGLPKISLKGRVISSGNTGTAILEVDGQIIAIGHGKEATIASSAGVVTLRVSQLDVSEVRLEVLPRNEQLVLH